MERKGWALFRLGDYEGSETAYRDAIQIDQEQNVINGFDLEKNTWHVNCNMESL